MPLLLLLLPLLLQGMFELLSAWAVRLSKGRMWALSLMLM